MQSCWLKRACWCQKTEHVLRGGFSSFQGLKGNKYHWACRPGKEGRCTRSCKNPSNVGDQFASEPPYRSRKKWRNCVAWMMQTSLCCSAFGPLQSSGNCCKHPRKGWFGMQNQGSSHGNNCSTPAEYYKKNQEHVAPSASWASDQGYAVVSASATEEALKKSAVASRDGFELLFWSFRRLKEYSGGTWSLLCSHTHIFTLTPA